MKINSNKITEYFLSGMGELSFVQQQKVGIFIWCVLFSSIILVVVSIINIFTTASSHPTLITASNIFHLITFLLVLPLIKKGHFNTAVIISTIGLFTRVMSGCLIKFDIYLQTGTNNNIIFMFLIIIFVSLFGTRTLLTVVSISLIFVNIAFAAAAKFIYNAQNINYITGSTINIVITIFGVYVVCYLLTSITDKALNITQEELDKNSVLNENLEKKVHELNNMFEKLEAMNEELEEAYQELMEKNTELEIFHDFAETSTQGFAFTNFEGRIEYANKAMNNMLVADNSMHMQGKLLQSFYSEESTVKLTEEIFPQVINHNSWTGELPLIKISGESFPAIQNFFLLRNSLGKPGAIACIYIDLSEKQKLEAQLMHAQKMEAIGRLAGGIAHDFNNFLTAITGYGGLLLSQMEADDPRVENVSEILKAAERSSALTRQLLTFSRKQILRPDVINVNNQITNMEKILARIIGENIKLIKHLDENLMSILIDPIQIEQIIMNLAINSRDAMPSGGKLTIQTKNHFQNSGNSNEANISNEKFICISVSDTGTGIQEEVSRKIFDPFFTTKEIGKGTGLGLSVIHTIITQNGGWIEFESELNSGAEFKVFLPAVDDRPLITDKKHLPLAKLKGNGERILIVEDQKEVRNFASTALLKNGYTIIDCENAAEAIIKFDSWNGQFDLVFSDVVLPDKSGLELMHILKKKQPDIKYLLSSGYTDHESEWKEIVDNGYYFLPKPYTLYELIESIYDILKK